MLAQTSRREEGLRSSINDSHSLVTTLTFTIGTGPNPMTWLESWQPERTLRLFANRGDGVSCVFLNAPFQMTTSAMGGSKHRLKSNILEPTAPPALKKSFLTHFPRTQLIISEA